MMQGDHNLEYFDNLRKMMAGSLGLEEPWYIEGVEFKEDELALHVYVGIRKAAANIKILKILLLIFA